MKKLMVLAVIAMMSLSGCFSSGFLGFLATQDYVDKKIKEQAAEIATLKTQVADFQSLKTQAQAAIDQMNQSQKTLEDLAGRVNNIPREVIRQIISILQASQSQ
jgi:outer membrane murein-binding lipoprotein Lpp